MSVENLSSTEVMAVLCRLTRDRVGPMTTRIGGAIAFIPRGAQRGWRLDLDVSGGAWSLIEARDAFASAVVVEATEASFTALLTGGESMRRCSAAGDIKIAGDRKKLEQLGRLLSRSGSLLSLRLGSARTAGTKRSAS